MKNEIEKKYDYLYNNKNVLTHFSEAIRGNEYKMYPNQSLDYTFKKGEIREYFSLKNDVTGSGESAEHYNAKMKIAHEKKYFDTIFQETVYFSKVVPEIFLFENKKPDLSCYDEDDNLICIIEILYSNKKTIEDIEKLKLNKVAVIQIDIKNGNKCEHLVLPILLESNRAEYNRLAGKMRNSKEKAERYKGIKNKIRNEQEFKQKTLRDNDEIIKKSDSIRDEIRRIESRKCKNTTTRSVREGIEKIKGLISWQDNRSKQARTICKRGF